jgi:molybdopterin-guanine dinucleotide biosynthesis protein A
MTLDGAILVGGQSRRFGSNKADIDLAGQTLLDRSRNVMGAALGTSVYVIGGQDHSDKRPNTGPLGGIETAFELSSADAVLVVACDMPGLTVELLQFLATHPSESTVVLPRVDARSHPLCARWCRSAADNITQALNEGRHSVMELLIRLDVTFVEASELKAHQIDPQGALFNVNRPADLALYKTKFCP